MLSDALRPAVAAGVLVTDDDVYAFRHALIREAVQDALLPGERSRRHAQLAQALEADPALAPDGRAAPEIAHHWHAAGDAARALPAAWRAAADAAAVLAYAEQLSMLDRVLGLWHAVPDAAALIGVGHLVVLEQAVIAAHLAGEPERGVPLADAALAELGAEADPARAFFVNERRSAMSLQLRRAEVAGLRAAADKVADDDPARPRVLAALAEQLIDAQQPDEARERGEQALAAARRRRDLVVEAGALATVAALAARRGELAAPLAGLAEARAIAEQGDGAATAHARPAIGGVGAGGLRPARAVGVGRPPRPRRGCRRRAGPDFRRDARRVPGRGAHLARPLGRGHGGHRPRSRPAARGRPTPAVAAPRSARSRSAAAIFGAAAAAFREARDEPQASSGSIATVEALMLTRAGRLAAGRAGRDRRRAGRRRARSGGRAGQHLAPAPLRLAAAVGHGACRQHGPRTRLAQ